MAQVPPHFVRYWDYWDADRGCWMGDNSIRVQEAPLVSGRMIKISNVTEDILMPREHNHDTNTMDDFGVGDITNVK